MFSFVVRTVEIGSEIMTSSVHVGITDHLSITYYLSIEYMNHFMSTYSSIHSFNGRINPQNDQLPTWMGMKARLQLPVKRV